MLAGLSLIRYNNNLKNPSDPPNPPNPPNPSNPYIYSDIVLCVKTTVHDFECYKFNSYDAADKYFKENYSKPNKENIYCSTMVPLSKLWPQFIEPYVLQLKLSNLFNNIKITKP